jgi:hypothetical protein
MASTEPDPTALQRCVEGATFAYSPHGGAAIYQIGVGGGMRYLHRRAAAWFARRHLAEHGRLPEGPYYVRVWAHSDDHEARGGIKNVYGGEKEVRVWVTYPPAPAR